MTRFYAVFVSCVVALCATVACGSTADEANEATESTGAAVAACAQVGGICTNVPCCGAPNFCSQVGQKLVCNTRYRCACAND
jgi:hypothetical protein